MIAGKAKLKRVMEASKRKKVSKKRPWRPEEDEVLLDYIESRGSEHWDLVAKNSGLRRDGKSCRLRWKNQLRPGLKKNLPLSKEEKSFIFSKHAVLGNQWSRIAKQLPGRTDNDIKNFVNTHMKKCLKTGTIPIYPPQISMKCTLAGASELLKIPSSDIADFVIPQWTELLDLPSIQTIAEDVEDSVLNPHLQNPLSSFESLPHPHLAAAQQALNTGFSTIFSFEQCWNFSMDALLYSDYSGNADLDSWFPKFI